MKKLLKKNRFACLVALVMAAIWAFAAISPSPLPAQDIDDVIQGLDRDFSVGDSKEDVKRSNLEAANEQNREDIKIEEKENPSIFLNSSCGYSGTYSGTYTDMSGSTSLTCSLSFNCSASSPIPTHFSGTCVDGEGINYSVSGNIAMLPSFSLTVTELNSCAAPGNSSTGSGYISGSGESGTTLSGSLPTTCDTGTTSFSITK